MAFRASRSDLVRESSTVGLWLPEILALARGRSKRAHPTRSARIVAKDGAPAREGPGADRRLLAVARRPLLDREGLSPCRGRLLSSGTACGGPPVRSEMKQATT